MSTALLNAPDDVEAPPFPDVDEPTVRIPVVDDDAPWGRRTDGTPKAKPGAKGTGAPRKAAAPRRRPAAAGPSKSKSNEPDYRPALVALAALPSFLLNIAARGVRDEKAKTALQLDGLAVKVHGPVMAEALNETAKSQAGLASALDKVVSAGPYGLILAAGVPFVMQLLANHGAIEPNADMGILSPQALVAAATAE